ncbi:MAG: hypothetical protein U1F41_13610, partial [Burkholderiales bacterium]
MDRQHPSLAPSSDHNSEGAKADGPTYLSPTEGVERVMEIGCVSSGVLDNALKGIDPDDLDVAISVLSRMKDNLEAMRGRNGGSGHK